MAGRCDLVDHVVHGGDADLGARKPWPAVVVGLVHDVGWRAGGDQRRKGLSRELADAADTIAAGKAIAEECACVPGGQMLVAVERREDARGAARGHVDAGGQLDKVAAYAAGHLMHECLSVEQDVHCGRRSEASAVGVQQEIIVRGIDYGRPNPASM